MITRGWIKARNLCGLALLASAAGAHGQSSAPTLATARVYTGEDAHRLPNGGESRNLLAGVLATGEAVAAHETMLPVGAPPNTAHANRHSELILIRTGDVTYEHDGKAEKASGGDVLLVPPGTVHALRNTGSTPARYFVVQLGGDTAR